jgi:hypothetical protein
VVGRVCSHLVKIGLNATLHSDLRLQTSDPEHEEEQERCIHASSFLRHSSFVIRASSFEACPSRQARDFEAVTGLTLLALLKLRLHSCAALDYAKKLMNQSSTLPRCLFNPLPFLRTELEFRRCHVLLEMRER